VRYQQAYLEEQKKVVELRSLIGFVEVDTTSIEQDAN
jgi:hypothetical protein